MYRRNQPRMGLALRGGFGNVLHRGLKLSNCSPMVVPGAICVTGEFSRQSDASPMAGPKIRGLNGMRHLTSRCPCVG